MTLVPREVLPSGVLGGEAQDPTLHRHPGASGLLPDHLFGGAEFDAHGCGGLTRAGEGPPATAYAGA